MTDKENYLRVSESCLVENNSNLKKNNWKNLTLIYEIKVFVA